MRSVRKLHADGLVGVEAKDSETHTADTALEGQEWGTRGGSL